MPQAEEARHTEWVLIQTMTAPLQSGQDNSPMTEGFPIDIIEDALLDGIARDRIRVHAEAYGPNGVTYVHGMAFKPDQQAADILMSQHGADAPHQAPAELRGPVTTMVREKGDGATGSWDAEIVSMQLNDEHLLDAPQQIILESDGGQGDDQLASDFRIVGEAVGENILESNGGRGDDQLTSDFRIVGSSD